MPLRQLEKFLGISFKKKKKITASISFKSNDKFFSAQVLKEGFFLLKSLFLLNKQNFVKKFRDGT